MPRVLVHNISKMAIKVAGVQVRPGKHLLVELDAVKAKTRRYHGSKLWFGPLPLKFQKKVPSAVRDQVDEPMGLEEVRLALHDYPYEMLLHMGTMMSPPFVPREGTPYEVLIIRLSRAMFQPRRTLDPQTFFWLRRWTTSGSLFLEK